MKKARGCGRRVDRAVVTGVGVLDDDLGWPHLFALLLLLLLLLFFVFSVT